MIQTRNGTRSSPSVQLLHGSRKTYLIRRIRYTNVEKRQFSLNNIAHHQLQLPLLRSNPQPHELPKLHHITADSLSKNTFLHFGRHTRIHLDRHYLLTLLEDPDGEIARPGTHFQYNIGWFEVGLGDGDLAKERRDGFSSEGGSTLSTILREL